MTTNTALDEVADQERSLKRGIRSGQIWGRKEGSQGGQLTEEKSRQTGQEG